MASKSKSKRETFIAKLGQLVSWELQGDNREKLGIITHIYDDGDVEVTFIKNNWIIKLSTRNLKLLNDV